MRTIEHQMIAYLDARLRSNGLAQHAVENKDARTLFRLACEACVGVRESTGHNDGPIVELMQKTIGEAEGESWCMSFMQTCIAYAEEKTGLKSPIVASEHCLTVWNETPKEFRVAHRPAPGAIVIWRHVPSTNGHTGCIISWLDAKFAAIEGNTSKGIGAAGAVVRNGDGVYATVRDATGNGSMRVLGFLKPFPIVG